MWTGDYEYAATTQRMIRLVHRTTTIRRSPFPYPYISKELFKELGGVIPQDGEQPTQVFRLTLELGKEQA